MLIKICPFGAAAADHVTVGYYLVLWGIFCGLSAIYNAMGQILNAEFGKKIIPLG